MPYRKPVPLGEHHVLAHFSCGEPALDDWLRHTALYNQTKQYTRTFVVADADFRVVGYCSLCAGMIHRDDAPRAVKGGQAPNEIPVALLARLAIDAAHQGNGLGGALMRHALRAVVSAGQTVAFRAVMVDAISESAADFYRKYGFRQSRISPTKLLLPIKDIVAALEAATK